MVLGISIIGVVLNKSRLTERAVPFHTVDPLGLSSSDSRQRRVRLVCVTVRGREVITHGLSVRWVARPETKQFPAVSVLLA